MSGAQPKAAKIAGLISVTAEVNAKAIKKTNGKNEKRWARWEKNKTSRKRIS